MKITFRVFFPMGKNGKILPAVINRIEGVYDDEEMERVIRADMLRLMREECGVKDATPENMENDDRPFRADFDGERPVLRLWHGDDYTVVAAYVVLPAPDFTTRITHKEKARQLVRQFRQIQAYNPKNKAALTKAVEDLLWTAYSTCWNICIPCCVEQMNAIRKLLEGWGIIGVQIEIFKSLLTEAVEDGPKWYVNKTMPSESGPMGLKERANKYKPCSLNWELEELRAKAKDPSELRDGLNRIETYIDLCAFAGCTLDKDGRLVLPKGTVCRFDSHGADSELKDRDGKNVRVEGLLPDGTYDAADTGLMYAVTFSDGKEIHVFEDELIPGLAEVL